MARRTSLPLVLALVVLGLVTAIPAAAQSGEAALRFGHDDALDGTPDEIVSGFWGGGDDEDGDGNPLNDRVPGSFETFPLTVPEGVGAFTVRIDWGDDAVDLDLFVYRFRPDGTLVPDAIRSSAAGGTDFEQTTYENAISSEAVEPGEYLIVVDNWCSSDVEADAVLGVEAGCDFDTGSPSGPAIDEDDFFGRVTFGDPLPVNPLPTAGLAGPDRVRVGELATFTASASDDGTIANYAFDLDGDGRFELDNARGATAARRFETPGVYNIGVQVTDDDGGRAFAGRRLVVESASAASAPSGSVAPGFALLPGSRLFSTAFLDSPAFGGRRGRTLTLEYTVLEPGDVNLTLYKGRRLVQRLSTGAREPGFRYRFMLRARNLKRGTYMLRLRHRSGDGRLQVVRLMARKL